MIVLIRSHSGLLIGELLSEPQYGGTRRAAGSLVGFKVNGTVPVKERVCTNREMNIKEI